MLESYQRWLYRYRKPNGQPLGITTQRARLGAVQRFFAWLCRQNLLHANPAADLELPRKRPRNLPKALTLDEVNRILNLPDIADPLGLRDRAMLEVFYATGLRRSELVGLDHEDLDPGLGVLRVRGKGNKQRMVPLGSRAVHWLSRYLAEVRPVLATDLNEHALFLSGYGERFSASYVGNWVRKQMDKAEIGRTGSCHLLRHSCATHMLEGGADIKIIQQLLGHARLDTTQIYTEVGIQTLREVHARTHPSCLRASKNGSCET
jgi:integrase/recombinase XerD